SSAAACRTSAATTCSSRRRWAPRWSPGRTCTTSPTSPARCARPTRCAWPPTPTRWAMRSRRCSPIRSAAPRWPPPGWSWSSRAAARWRGPWRWSAATCRGRRRPDRGPRTKRPGEGRAAGACGTGGLLHVRLHRLRLRVVGELGVGVDRQQAVDLLHVVVVQRTGGLLEQQPVLQVVVLGDGVGLARVEQVLLVDEYVQHGARAHFQADLRGVVGGVGRDHGQATGLDLGDAGHQGLVGVAGIALDRALLLLVLVLADVAVGDRLAHARLGEAAGEDRHGQGQADGAALALALQRTHVGAAPGVVVTVAGAETKRRVVPAARGRDALLRGRDLVVERPERRVVLDRRSHPRIGVAAGRELRAEIVRQALQV